MEQMHTTRSLVQLLSAIATAPNEFLFQILFLKEFGCEEPLAVKRLQSKAIQTSARTEHNPHHLLLRIART